MKPAAAAAGLAVLLGLAPGAPSSARSSELPAEAGPPISALIEQAKLTASDGSLGDLFGVSVDVDGDTVVVGATSDDVDGKVNQGSAYVFVKPAGGWSQPVAAPARLFASDGAAGDLFGAVAVHGDVIVVGAGGNSPASPPPGTTPIPGAAYVFVKPAGGWSGTLTEQAKLTASDAAPNDKFGASVAISGDVIVAGAEWDNNFRGAAYVFVKPAAGWSGPLTENAKLIASDGKTGIGIGDAFGRAAIQGDRIVVGALGADIVTGGFNFADAGAAYVFEKPAAGWTGLLTQRAKLRASDVSGNDRFGAAVALDGEVIVAGAPLDGTGAEGQHGSAYVFVKPAAGWANATQTAKLLASDQEAGDQLGVYVAVEGDTIAVGAYLSDIGASPADNNGSAYVFERPAGGWHNATEDYRLIAPDPGPGDEFGSALALSGGVLVVGARRDDVGPRADQGSVYVFVGERRPATVQLDPETAENPVGTDHAVTATVRDAEGQPIADVALFFDVAGSVTTSGSCTTDAVGQCAFTYAGPTAPGSDAITAFADRDGDGVQGPEEPSGLATKTWVAGAPAAIVLAPAASENPVATSHTVTARVTDAFGNLTPRVNVVFQVTGAVTTGGPCVTDGNGECAFTYAGPTALGSDTIAAFADTNGDGMPGSGEPSATATKTWVPGAPATVVLSPAVSENPVGTTHDVMAVVVDAFGNRIPAVIVRLAVTGAVTTSGQCLTDLAGQCGFGYAGPGTVGSDTITAFADTDGDGVRALGEPAAVATKTWVPGAGATVTVTPPADTNPVGTQHCVTATVRDGFGNPVPGLAVRFGVSGTVTTHGTGVTDGAGQASFCYLGPSLPGADEIAAHADLDGDGLIDAGEPVGGAAKTWLLPDSTTGHVSGGGLAPAAAPGRHVAFAFHAKSSAASLKGQCVVIDLSADVWIRCLDVQAFVRQGTRATIFGNAVVNRVATTYRIDVDEQGEPGGGHDVFHVSTGTGYAAGGVIAHGNVQVR